MEHKALPPEVAAFVTIVQGTQTRELHEWNRESLERALQWAKFLETASAKWDKQTMDEQLRRELPTATLPSIGGGVPERISIKAVQNATSVMLHAILQSAYLPSHPIRSELCLAVLKALKQQEAAVVTRTGATEASSNEIIGQFMTQQVQTERRTTAMLEIAALMSQGARPIRVQVLEHIITIPCLQSYLLHPRTLQLRSLAQTLQANSIGAKVLSSPANPKAYRAFLEGIATQLRAEDSESKEVIALLVLREWEPEFEDVRNGLVQILQQWIAADSMGSAFRRFLVFPPWCAAQLAALAPSLADQYIPSLLREGFLHPEQHKDEYRTRVGALLLQNHQIEARVLGEVQTWEPEIRHKYFHQV